MNLFRSHTLVVDDDPQFVDLLGLLLRQDDAVEHDIEVAGSLAGAMKALASADRDVVLLDLGLPDSQGRGTLRAVVEAAGDTPVIVLTSTGDWGFRNPAIRLGAEDYVLKVGVEADVLNRSVRHAVERRRLRVELDRTREQARREQEFRAMARLADERREASGQSVPLAIGDPELFSEARAEYAAILEVAVRAETHVTPDDVRGRIRALATVLAGRGATPADVMGLHTATMHAVVDRVPHGEVQAWVREGRLSVLALMGDLANVYRTRAG